MTLKGRLGFAIILLVFAVVVSQSLLNLHHAAGVSFHDAGERAYLLANQMKVYAFERLLERYRPREPVQAEERRRRWRQIIQEDKLLSRVLQRTRANSSVVSDVLIVDDAGLVLASGGRFQPGVRAPVAAEYEDFQSQPTLQRLRRVLRGEERFVVAVPIGVMDGSEPAMAVRVLVSSALLRERILPSLRDLLLLSGVLLIAAILMAAAVSRVVGKSLDRIKRSVELASAGQIEELRRDRFESKELAEVQWRLTRLGERFVGAQEHAERLRSNIDRLLENLEEAVFVFDADGRLQSAGAAAERLLAKPRSELLGKTFQDIFPVWTELAKAVEQGRPVHGTEVTLPRGDLEPVALLVDVDFAEGGMTVFRLRDAATRREVRSGLNLASQLTALNRLMSGVAHEMKNPLNAIQLHAGVLREALDGDAQLGTASRVIEQEVARLDKVVKTFLDFNQPLEVRLSSQDLGKLTAEVTDLMLPEASSRGVELSLEVKGQTLINADPDLLKQAILNVLSNAIEASPSPGKVNLQVACEARFCLLTVHDNGPGIPPDVRDRVFHLYFTTKEGGSGLGLAMAFRVVQLHGGSIEFETEGGNGTDFRLKLPSVTVS